MQKAANWFSIRSISCLFICSPHFFCSRRLSLFTLSYKTHLKNLIYAFLSKFFWQISGVTECKTKKHTCEEDILIPSQICFVFYIQTYLIVLFSLLSYIKKAVNAFKNLNIVFSPVFILFHSSSPWFFINSRFGLLWEVPKISALQSWCGLLL